MSPTIRLALLLAGLATMLVILDRLPRAECGGGSDGQCHVRPPKPLRYWNFELDANGERK